MLQVPKLCNRFSTSSRFGSCCEAWEKFNSHSNGTDSRNNAKSPTTNSRRWQVLAMLHGLGRQCLLVVVFPNCSQTFQTCPFQGCLHRTHEAGRHFSAPLAYRRSAGRTVTAMGLHSSLLRAIFQSLWLFLLLLSYPHCWYHFHLRSSCSRP